MCDMMTYSEHVKFWIDSIYVSLTRTVKKSIAMHWPIVHAVLFLLVCQIIASTWTVRSRPFFFWNSCRRATLLDEAEEIELR